MAFKKPIVWIVFAGIIGFLNFFIGSQFENSINVTGWSSLIALYMNIPPRRKNGLFSKEEMTKMIDDFYEEMGIRNGRLLYRVGLFSFVLFSLVGWIVCYGEVVSLR
jgi:hypothetical protein